MTQTAQNLNTPQNTIIMCPPNFLEIRSAENGNGNRKEEAYYTEYAADPDGFREKALQQWQGLKDIYAEWGMTVLEIVPTPGMTDQVFTADPAFTIINHDKNELIILKSEFTNAARRTEVIPFVQLTSQAAKQDMIKPGLRIREHQMLNRFEGTGDCYYDQYRDLIFAGYTNNPDPANPQEGRSSIESHAEVEAQTGIEVISLEIKDPCFHIDTCLAPLPSGHMLVYKDGMTDDSYKLLIKKAFIDRGLDPEEYLIPVTENDALSNYVTNMQCIGDKIVMPQFDKDIYEPVDTALIQRLEDIGYEVKVHEYGQMIKVGGAMHCSSHMIAERVIGGLINQKAHDPLPKALIHK